MIGFTIRLCIYSTLVIVVFCKKPPNIVVIVADDLGWNDVSFHGSSQIPTPHIDRLASEGVILNNYYVCPICSPSRSALMTGKYPIHTGMQVSNIRASTRSGLGLNETLLPQHLKKLGYRTHAIGKWHLGFYAKELTPTYRGFDTYYGYYLGMSDYWNHHDRETYYGLDLHKDEEPVWNEKGKYSTELFTSAAERTISKHNTSEPLFMYVAYQAVHSALPTDPLQAPQEWIDKYKHIKHHKRRVYAAMVGYMDYGIGRIHSALMKKGILDDTVIVFTTDNGGPANGFDWNWANNFPLRGVKATLFEGGVRGAGFVYSKLLKWGGRVSRDLMHITDWVPTLLNIAGGDATPLALDGVDQWDTLQAGEPSPRNEILLNIIDIDYSYKNQALIVGDYKIVKEGPHGKRWGGWYPPPGVSSNFSSTLATTSHIDCGGSIPSSPAPCLKQFCLFDLRNDPCEFHDLSSQYHIVRDYMILRMEAYNATAVPPRRNKTSDPLSNPELHGEVWEPWVHL